MTEQSSAPRVALFVTCLVDLFRPSVGWAAVKLLQDAGCTVEVPAGQTCCGQPAYNSGDRADARAIAARTIDQLVPYDYIVAPSGSCAAMIRLHYPALFEADPVLASRARDVAQKTFELTSFLADVMKTRLTPPECNETVAYHDGCSGLRELDVRAQPRALLGAVPGLQLTEMRDADVCCGFGGTFCVKYPEVSTAMVDKKTANAEKTGASMLLAGDLGCLMNIAGRLRRQGSPLRVRHVAEVLAGMMDKPAIGEEEA